MINHVIVLDYQSIPYYKNHIGGNRRRLFAASNLFGCTSGNREYDVLGWTSSLLQKHKGNFADQPAYHNANHHRNQDTFHLLTLNVATTQYSTHIRVDN